jgi:hypothetical protein
MLKDAMKLERWVALERLSECQFVHGCPDFRGVLLKVLGQADRAVPSMLDRPTRPPTT